MLSIARDILAVTDDIELELLNLHHRDEIFLLVDQNREWLRQWLPWVERSRNRRDTEKFLHAVIRKYHSGEGPQYAILYRSFMCGVCGFNRIDNANRMGSIGYWLSESYTGRGIMTETVSALLGIGFGQYRLNKIEILCATDNLKSRAVPERLGFHHDGILRQNELLNGAYVDHAVYSLLAEEYIRGRDRISG